VNRGAVLFVSSVLCSTAYGATDGAERIAARLEPVARFSAEFVQTVRGSRREVRESAEGYIHIERPRRFKWVVEDPYPQVIVTKGEELYIYDPDLDQVQVRAFDEAMQGTPALVLAGNAAEIDAQFDVVERSEGDATVFTLTPKSPQALYTELMMTFAADDLVGIDIVDSLGQVTEVRFYNGTRDAEFPQNEFDFTVPPNADVIGNADPGPA
jgi:outer membrane lipoprotein carrier protein